MSMNMRDKDQRGAAQRARIAVAAARLMAEDGLGEYAAAKRKAAQMLGLPATAALPEDAEVEAELRLRQRLFEPGHDQRIDYLRRKALACMRLLSDFRPHLSGAVLDGTAGQHADIDIQLFPDSPKDVEIFLLNRGMGFEPAEPRSERADMVLTLRGDDGVDINLVLYPARDERVAFKARDGRLKPRAGIDALRLMLGEK